MSTLSQELDRYLAVRRGLGFELRTDERILKRFIEYVERKGVEYVNADIFMGWRKSFGAASQQTWARRLGIVRIFAHWLHGIDPRHEVPFRDLIPIRQRRNRPYIYTLGEIRAIVETAATLPSINGIRSLTYPALFGLIAVTGEMFVVLARRWQADEKRIWSDVKQMQGVDLGHIRLVTMDSLVNSVLPHFLHHVASIYPRVRIDMEIATPDDAVVVLDEGNADVALAFNVRPQRDVHILWSEQLPLLCVMAPGHPLAQEAEIRLLQVRDHPIAVQSPALAIRRMIDARHGWVFSGDRPPVATNSLQLLKHLVLSGSHIALTSELDTAQELLDGTLVARPLTGQNIGAQNIAVAISSKRMLPRIATRVADLLTTNIMDTLRSVRSCRLA